MERDGIDLKLLFRKLRDVNIFALISEKLEFARKFGCVGVKTNLYIYLYISTILFSFFLFLS